MKLINWLVNADFMKDYTEFLKKQDITPNKVMHILIGVILYLVVTSGIFFYFWGIDIINYLPHISPCPFHIIIGMSCPGCGMTRAFLNIGQLKIKDAIQLNPFSIPLLFIMIIYLFLGYIPSWLQHKVLVRFAVLAIFTIWILRLFNA